MLIAPVISLTGVIEGGSALRIAASSHITPKKTRFAFAIWYGGGDTLVCACASPLAKPSAMATSVPPNHLDERISGVLILSLLPTWMGPLDKSHLSERPAAAAPVAAWPGTKEDE